MNDSRIPGLYRLDVGKRIDDLERRGWLTAADAQALRSGHHILSPRAGDRMIENVIASFGLPLGIAPNFIVNGRDYIVPLVVEEPSVVAALSAAARLTRESGGFTTECTESLLIGQVHVHRLDDTEAAAEQVLAASDDLLRAANAVHPGLVERGGGARQIEVRTLALASGESAIAVHVLVDTCDAMGANLVNTICERIAPDIESLCGGSAVMKILSNLSDRALVTARVRCSLDDAERDAIVLANEIAMADPYRAATHNKGILNGIDSLAIATGNDWRAIEAGAHAYASSSGSYRPLTSWSVDDGDLLGEICLPLKVGIVGGTSSSNPSAGICRRIAGVESASELAGLMAAVGLAQNLAALRALGTTGIQHGHMRLHARSVATSAGVPDHLFDDVVDELADSGEVKDWKAREILLARESADRPEMTSRAAGKVILLGEHAVVYGRRALALPVPGAVAAVATTGNAAATVTIPGWSLHHELGTPRNADIEAAVTLIANKLGVELDGVAINVESRLPRGMGLGSSAAIVVAMTRALAEVFDVSVDDERINDIAFECEKLAHGTPSGVDNTIATFGRPLLFRRGESLESQFIETTEVPPLLVACSHSPGSTREQVAGVRERRDALTAQYEAVFDEIDGLSEQGASALQDGNYTRLGALMNVCHGLLNAIEVSTPELEHMISLARANGAVGAKLTGGGGGGSIIALCPDSIDAVAGAFDAAGYPTISLAG